MLGPEALGPVTIRVTSATVCVAKPTAVIVSENVESASARRTNRARKDTVAAKYSAIVTIKNTAAMRSIPSTFQDNWLGVSA
jgi:hypothetical protein